MNVNNQECGIKCDSHELICGKIDGNNRNNCQKNPITQ